MIPTDAWDEKLAGMIDHTILAADATDADIRERCAEVVCYSFAAMVVPPFYVAPAVDALAGTAIPVCSVVAFPLGSDTPEAKVDACRRLLDDGATEVDMVMNVGAFRAGNHDVVRSELRGVASACKDRAVFKYIIETAYLDERSIAVATKMAVEGGVDFVKTSTGFASRGASVEDVRMMSSAAKGRAGIKASGGIRTREFALELVQAGATRLGCSESLSVISIRP